MNQMQSLLRITGKNGSESLLKLLLLRLDEQGLEVSTPWVPQAGLLISEILWPQLWRAWRAKEASSLIDHRAPLFSSGEARATWEQAKHCLLAQWHSVSSVKLESSWFRNSEDRLGTGCHCLKCVFGLLTSLHQNIRLFATG